MCVDLVNHSCYGYQTGYVGKYNGCSEQQVFASSVVKEQHISGWLDITPGGH